MTDTVKNLGKKALAIVVLLAAAFVIFKFVVGLIASVAWLIVAVIAVFAIVWAVRTL